MSPAPTFVSRDRHPVFEDGRLTSIDVPISSHRNLGIGGNAANIPLGSVATTSIAKPVLSVHRKTGSYRLNKKELTEADIRTKFITPAIVGASGEKWDVMTQLREEIYFTKGRVIVRGKTVKRGEAKKVDYLLFYKPNIPIAVVEAKDNNHSVGAGMQQALEYAEILDVPFACSSNGDGFLEHDRTGAGDVVERELRLDQFRERSAMVCSSCGRAVARVLAGRSIVFLSDDA